MPVRHLDAVFKPAAIGLVVPDADPGGAVPACNMIGGGFCGPVLPEDEPAWHALFARMTPQGVRLRFCPEAGAAAGAGGHARRGACAPESGRVTVSLDGSARSPHVDGMKTAVTPAAAAAIRTLGESPAPADIARAITVVQHPDHGTVIVTPDEALDMGDLAAIQARRKLLEKLDRQG